MIAYTIIPAEAHEFVRRLFILTREELKDPLQKEAYLSGEKDITITERFLPLLNETSSAIHENYSFSMTVGDAGELAFKKSRFFSDLYTQLVTTVITLGAFRRNDITPGDHFSDMLDAIAEQLEENKDVQYLDRLRDHIAGLKGIYESKPVLQYKVNSLVKTAQNIFVVEPAKSIDAYSNLEVIARITDGIVISEAGICELPEGLVLDAEEGAVKVSDPSLLKPGTYTFSISANVDGYPSTENISIKIGESEPAVYSVPDAKIVSEYSEGDLLASVSVSGSEIALVELMQGTLPPGTSFDKLTGRIVVSDPSGLKTGSYSISLRVTDEFDRITDATIALTFKEEPRSSVTLFPVKPMMEYQSGTVLAKIQNTEDEEVSIEVTGLPPGVTLDPLTGDISITDKTALIPGSFPLRICATLPDGTHTTSMVTLEFGTKSDTPAVYTVAGPKRISEYQEGDVLATVSDPDGPVTAAGFISGQVPPGTGVNKFNGTVFVTDVTKLIPGNYEMTLSTTDAKGGTSINVVDITLGADVIYRIERKRNIDSYTDGSVLALASFPGAQVVSAQVISGELPPGTSMQQSGSVIVENAALLEGGTYTATIGVTTDTQIYDTETITLELLPDNDAVYTYAAPRNRDSYKKGDVLATVSDPDGSIVKAAIVRGNLPKGIVLDLSTGALSVEKPELLLSGTFTGTVIRTEDIFGGKTDHTITLLIKDDKQAIYTLNPSKPQNAYRNGDVLAVAFDEDGEIFSASVIEGTLPPGSALNMATGELAVADSSRIKAGTYTFKVETADASGGITVNSLTIEVQERVDIEASYVVSPARNVDSYSNGTVLAAPSDPDGEITSAVLVSGALPPGTALSPTTGAIAVTSSEMLVPGTYNATVLTTDEEGGTSELEVTIAIAPDREAVYTLAPVKKYNKYYRGEVIASVTDEDGPIVSARIVAGSLPKGIALNEKQGQLYVYEEGGIEATNTKLRIETFDSTGGRTLNDIVIVIADDSEAVYVVEAAKTTHSLRTYDKLAAVTDPDGAIKRAVLTGGALPNGAALYTGESAAPGGEANDLPAVTFSVGDIYVSNRAALAAGSYTVNILTEDETGGTTEHTITIVIKSAGPTIKREFIGETGPRMRQIRKKHERIIRSEDVVNTTVMDLSEAMFDKIALAYSDPAKEAQYRSGEKDSLIRTDMISATSPVKEGILIRKKEIQEATGEQRLRMKQDFSFFLDLYNEQMVTIVELLAHRNADLSSNPEHDINVLLGTLKGQMQQLKSVPEATFIRLNLLAVMNEQRTKPKLRAKINDMLA